jgi:hypothetical protein
MAEFLLYVVTRGDKPLLDGESAGLMEPYAISERVDPCLDHCEQDVQAVRKPCCPLRPCARPGSDVPNARPKWKEASLCLDLKLPLKPDVKDENRGYRVFDGVPVDSLDLDPVPAPTAIITPDGAWHEAGETDFEGTELEEWPVTVRRILETCADKFLTAFTYSTEYREEPAYFGVG